MFNLERGIESACASADMSEVECAAIRGYCSEWEALLREGSQQSSMAAETTAEVAAAATAKWSPPG